MPRYVRDEILIQGIQLASVPGIIQHDMPGGAIVENAYSILWLQSALDMFHIRYPFSSDVNIAALALDSNRIDLTLLTDPLKYFPSDYILDVRDGVICTVSNVSYRLKRRGFQYYLNYASQWQNQTVNSPRLYTIINKRIKIAPTVNQSVSFALWYYAMPNAIAADDYPNFPDEWTLIEFIRLKSLEWSRSIDVGSAQEYMTKEFARLRSAGLINNAEYEGIPNEVSRPIDTIAGSWDWMGEPHG